MAEPVRLYAVTLLEQPEGEGLRELLEETLAPLQLLGAALACRSPRRVLVGPDEEWRTVVEATREELVRYPGEEKLYRWTQRWEQRVDGAVFDSWWGEWIHGLSRFAGTV